MGAKQEPMGGRLRRGTIVLSAGVVLAVVGTFVGPLSPASATYTTICNATVTLGTGLAQTTTSPINVQGLGTNYTVHRFTGAGTYTITFPKSVSVDYTIIGGGGGGGNALTTRGAGGGGAGGVTQGSFDALATSYTVTVGAGGAGAPASGNATGTPGTNSSITFTGTPTGNGGGGGRGSSGAASNGGSGGGGSGKTTAAGTGTAGQGRNGGAGRSTGTRAGGGGGGQSNVGVAASAASGGAGGPGISITNYVASSSEPFAAGGGGSRATTSGGGAGGATGGGAGGHTLSTAGGNATTAGSGGGGGIGAGKGGDGATGIVLIRYRANGTCPNAPVASMGTPPTLTWAAPTYVPTNQSVASYTVVYREASRSGPDGWAVYAKDSTATSINVSHRTLIGCTAGNPLWTCSLTSGDLQAGTSYNFRVYAKTGSSLSAMSTAIAYTP